MFGFPFTYTSDTSEWRVSGIGVVKESGTVNGEFFSRELVSFELPEPSTGGLGLVALGVLALYGFAGGPREVLRPSPEGSDAASGPR